MGKEEFASGWESKWWCRGNVIRRPISPNKCTLSPPKIYCGLLGIITTSLGLGSHNDIPRSNTSEGPGTMCCCFHANGLSLQLSRPGGYFACAPHAQCHEHVIAPEIFSRNRLIIADKTFKGDIVPSNQIILPAPVPLASVPSTVVHSCPSFHTLNAHPKRCKPSRRVAALIERSNILHQYSPITSSMTVSRLLVTHDFGAERPYQTASPCPFLIMTAKRIARRRVVCQRSC